MANPNTDYDEIVTTTIDRYRKKLADNVLDHIPLLKMLKEKGNTDTAPGGDKLLENLMYAETSTFKWYSGYETWDVSASDVLTSAAFDWKQANVNVVVSGLETMKNSGSAESKFNLVRSRIMVSEKTLMNNLAAALFYSNTENDGKSIGGLQHLVADDPTTGTVGGIDRSSSSNAFWRNQAVDASDESITPSNSTIFQLMNLAYIRTARNNDVVDLFVAGEDYFTYYLEYLQEKQRFVNDNNDNGSRGALTLPFWGGKAKVMYDPNCSATRMYALNLDYIHFRPHSERNILRLDRRAPVNQDALVYPMVWGGNMTVSNASLQGVIKA